MDQEQNKKYWESKAKEVRGVVNVAWWLQRFMPLFILMNVAMALLLLFAKRQQWDLNYFWETYWAAAAVLGLVAVLWAKGRFISKHDAVIRIEHYLKMNNALTAAREGYVSWPEPRPVPDLSFRYRVQPVLNPIAISLAILIAGYLMPIKGVAAKSDDLKPEQPQAWSQVEEWMEHVDETTELDKEKIEEVEEKIGELRAQDPDEWYSQSSLEAGDNLREQTADSIQNLHADAAKVAGALQGADQAAKLGDERALKKFGEMFAEGMKGLELGNLPLNQEMLNQLKDVGKNLGQMDPKKLQDLLDRLDRTMKACSECQGLGNMPGDQPGEGDGKPGRGGINRGRGDAEMSHKDKPDLLDGTQAEAVSNEDLTDAAVGDLRNVSTVEADAEEVEFGGPAQTAGTANTGRGGEAVWKNNLTPDERKILKDFYK